VGGEENRQRESERERETREREKSCRKKQNVYTNQYTTRQVSHIVYALVLATTLRDLTIKWWGRSSVTEERGRKE
jgi:hypothetical protein